MSVAKGQNFRLYDVSKLFVVFLYSLEHYEDSAVASQYNDSWVMVENFFDCLCDRLLTVAFQSPSCSPQLLIDGLRDNTQHNRRER